jgi:hypothetical protein
MAIGYCMTCKTKRTMRKLRETIGKNNCRVIKGNCVKCDREINLLMGKKDVVI